jgi:hypothetical protein
MIDRLSIAVAAALTKRVTLAAITGVTWKASKTERIEADANSAFSNH